jgi:hypothetical protein
MDNQQMYTYKLAVETWHCLLQLNGNHVDPPPSRTSTIEIPTIIDQPNSHCPLQPQCTSLLASYGTDIIMFDDLPSILFILVERATTLRFVELAYTLNHLQKLHYLVVDEAHLFLSNFKPIMKRLLPLWAMGC